ncbi:MAG: hypothetical protein VX223_02180 [Myxococcota bacterium]|nr:hypothetical protein [Myxococcota bacterium]
MAIAIVSLQAPSTYQSELVPTTGSSIGMGAVIPNRDTTHHAVTSAVNALCMSSNETAITVMCSDTVIRSGYHVFVVSCLWAALILSRTRHLRQGVNGPFSADFKYVFVPEAKSVKAERNLDAEVGFFCS